MTITLSGVLDEAAELEPLGPTAARLIELVAGDDWELPDVVEAVVLDAPLTAQVLRAANSTLYGGVAELGDIAGAVARLGAGMVLSFSLAHDLRAAGAAADESLWRHSVATAVAAEQLRRAVNIEVHPSVYAAALLHDIGRLVISRFIAPAARADGAVDAGVEDVDHAQLGAKIARRWDLPRTIVRAIADHHTPEDDPDPVVDAVHLADVIAHCVDDDGREASLEVLARLEVDPGSLGHVAHLVRDELDEVLALYALA